MYTSYIGRKFLNLYRENTNQLTGYKAEQFFEEEIFPIFFNDEQHLMHVGNSPFFQKPTSYDIAKHGSKALAQYHNLKEKIKNGPPNFSVYVGYAAEDIQATSSGQLTDLSTNIDSEEMYASWIGQALAVGVSGGLICEDCFVFLLTN